ncbi:hypothetical protein [Yinghuangia seranimata]|uniref:hypothetical protein n=1 Tax=Yinghuangia seranimata TaxID=408067 RepID=UPI00248C56F8|nr:hypothetical protein [Yinghuangia seranimata]MDI2127452.1 hypothetical protein [Yinghuangia seranimata]
MTEHYHDDAYDGLDSGGYDDTSMDHSFGDEPGNDQLWETGSIGGDLDQIDFSDDVPPGSDFQPSDPAANLDGDISGPALDDPAASLDGDISGPALDDSSVYNPADSEAQGDLNPDGSPVEPPEWATNPSHTDPWIQDQVDDAAAHGLNPDGTPLDVVEPGTDDPYGDPYDNTDPGAQQDLQDQTDAQAAGHDPNDPNVGLDPSDPSYDHYYAENGHVYDGPTDVSDDPYAEPVPHDGHAPHDGPAPHNGYEGYDPEQMPTEYPYEDPFATDGYDPGYDPYGDPNYNPYEQGPYGGDFDVYDGCFGDASYDAYSIYIDVDVTIDGDVYSGDPADISYDGSADADTYAPVDDSPDTHEAAPVVAPEPHEAPAPAHDTHEAPAPTHDTHDSHLPVEPHYDGHDPAADAPYNSFEISHYSPEWALADFDGSGDPAHAAQFFHGVEDPAHAPLAVEGGIVEAMTGEPYNEQAFLQQAQAGGLWDQAQGGMLNTDVGGLLEMHGIETTTVYDANVDTIINALDHGDQVIAVVDTNETGDALHDAVTGQPIEQNPPLMNTVWVTGVDVQPDGSAYVIVNDPSWPEGQTQAIALEDFTNAWADSGNQTVIAHAPAAAGS